MFGIIAWFSAVSREFILSAKVVAGIAQPLRQEPLRQPTSLNTFDWGIMTSMTTTRDCASDEQSLFDLNAMHADIVSRAETLKCPRTVGHDFDS